MKELFDKLDNIPLQQQIELLLYVIGIAMAFSVLMYKGRNGFITLYRRLIARKENPVFKDPRHGR